MEGKVTKISYNEKDDILFVYKKGRVKGNIMVGSFIIDISYRNEMIGMEVLNASESLEMFSITKEMMKYAKSAKLVNRKNADGIFFFGFEILSTIPNKDRIEKTAIVAMPEISSSTT